MLPDIKSDVFFSIALRFQEDIKEIQILIAAIYVKLRAIWIQEENTILYIIQIFAHYERLLRYGICKQTVIARILLSCKNTLNLMNIFLHSR